MKLQKHHRMLLRLIRRTHGDLGKDFVDLTTLDLTGSKTQSVQPGNGTGHESWLCLKLSKSGRFPVMSLKNINVHKFTVMVTRGGSNIRQEVVGTSDIQEIDIVMKRIICVNREGMLKLTVNHSLGDN